MGSPPPPFRGGQQRFTETTDPATCNAHLAAGFIFLFHLRQESYKPWLSDSAADKAAEGEHAPLKEAGVKCDEGCGRPRHAVLMRVHECRGPQLVVVLQDRQRLEAQQAQSCRGDDTESELQMSSLVAKPGAIILHQPGGALLTSMSSRAMRPVWPIMTKAGRERQASQPPPPPPPRGCACR